jgi:hypothetical protein
LEVIGQAHQVAWRCLLLIGLAPGVGARAVLLLEQRGVEGTSAVFEQANQTQAIAGSVLVLEQRAGMQVSGVLG